MDPRRTGYTIVSPSLMRVPLKSEPFGYANLGIVKLSLASFNDGPIFQCRQLVSSICIFTQIAAFYWFTGVWLPGVNDCIPGLRVDFHSATSLYSMLAAWIRFGKALEKLMKASMSSW